MNVRVKQGESVHLSTETRTSGEGRGKKKGGKGEERRRERGGGGRGDGMMETLFQVLFILFLCSTYSGVLYHTCKVLKA